MKLANTVERAVEIARVQMGKSSEAVLYLSPLVFLKAAIEDLNTLFNHIDYATLDRASQALAGARNVLIASTVNDIESHSILHFAGTKWFRNWRMSGPYEAGKHSFVTDIRDGGVLVAIARPPYDYQVLRAALDARNCGARVIGITDTPDSPLSIATPDLLITPVSSRAVFKSYACLTTLAEMLVVMAAARRLAQSAPDANQ